MQKAFTLFFLVFLVAAQSVFADGSTNVVVSGANGVVDETGYATLKEAFDAINANADHANRNIEIRINANTTETASAVLNQPSTTSWKSLTIYPTANVTVTGSFVGAIIDLNGADSVIINGRLNKTGVANSLAIEHTSNSDNSNRTVRLINDAKNNTIQYCKISGRCPSNGSGVIFLSTTNAVDGNDSNIIEYNDVDAMGFAAACVSSVGTSDKTNSGNILRYNTIHDFYLGDASTTSTYGINVGSGNSAWEITGNSVYQTVSRAYSTTATNTHYGIYIYAATGNDFVVKDNFIGGSGPSAGGTAWTVTGGAVKLIAMLTNVGVASASSVQNNVIANFSVTTAVTTTSNSYGFCGYQHFGGSVNAGTLTGNTIGSTTAASSIVVRYTAATLAHTTGMDVYTGSTATQVFANNKIGGIVADYLESSTNRGNMYGINVAGAGTVGITNNLIGSLTVPNSMEHKGSLYTTSSIFFRGISAGNTRTSTITGNTIANLTASSTGTMAVNGIYHNGAGVNTISDNTIRDIKSNGTKVIATQSSDAALIGVVIGSNSAGNIISSNKIYNLENTNTTLATDVYGINFHSLNAGASTIEKNKIYNLKTSSSDVAANVVGISITQGLTNTSNNMISLGDGLTNAVSIVGIRKMGTTNLKNNNFFHNTVVIGGAEVGIAGLSHTAAFSRITTSVDTLKNNIFINKRSNSVGNTQKHYVMNLNDTATFVSDYNVVSNSGLGGAFAVVGATDCADLQAWRVAALDDSNSRVSAVDFANAVNADLTIAGLSVQDVNLKVPALKSVITDALGTLRNTMFTYAGAHESLLPFPSTGLSDVKSKLNLLTTDSGILMRLNELSSIELYGMNGVLIEKSTAQGVYARSLGKGMYLIKVNGISYKFVKL